MPERRRAPAPPPVAKRRRSIAQPLTLVLIAAGAGAAFAPQTRPYVTAVATTVVARADAFLNPRAGAVQHDAARDSVVATPPAAPTVAVADSAAAHDSSATAAADSAIAAPSNSAATVTGRLPVAPLPVEGALPANFRMAPTAAVGFIRIVTRGGSARARVDGRTLGFTPYVARVEPGMHYVSVEGAGDIFLPTQHSIDAAEGDTADAVFTAPGASQPPRRPAPPVPVAAAPVSATTPQPATPAPPTPDTTRPPAPAPR
jgi:hypothetical protein